MIAMDNALIGAFPEVTFAVHLCRGNHRSMWSVEGGYDAIAEQLFNDLACDADPGRVRLTPSRNVRAAALRAAGQDRGAGPDHHQGAGTRGRGPAQAAHRRGVALLPLERLALSPQCGFASTLPGNKVTEADQRAKLELVGRVARDVWG